MTSFVLVERGPADVTGGPVVPVPAGAVAVRLGVDAGADAVAVATGAVVVAAAGADVADGVTAADGDPGAAGVDPPERPGAGPAEEHPATATSTQPWAGPDGRLWPPGNMAFGFREPKVHDAVVEDVVTAQAHVPGGRARTLDVVPRA